MCIIFLHFSKKCCEKSSKYMLIFAANRDEAFHRPSKDAGFWEEAPHVLGGRDLTPSREGGTWLAMTRKGKFGMLTNYRQATDMNLTTNVSNLKPRGQIVTNYVKEHHGPVKYINDLINEREKYSKFNVLFGNYDKEAGFDVFYGSNALQQKSEDYKLKPGIHGLCNAEIDCSWTKVQRGKAMFSDIISKYEEKDVLIEKLFELMHNDQEYYPNDGGSRVHVREDCAAPMSSIFVKIPQIQYGTRTITIVLVDDQHQVTFIEKSMKDPKNIDDPKWQTNRFDFQLET